MDKLPHYEDRVLLLAPTRRDAQVTMRALGSADVHCTECADLPTLLGELDSGAGAVMFTDAALRDARFARLVAQLERQPPWSNLPTILLCRDREHSPHAWPGLDRLRNLTLLDRPTSMRLMVSAVQAALRGRRWQYQIRDQLFARRLAEEALRQADQRKDQFLATLAHELRNPLAAVNVGLQVLRRQPTLQAQHDSARLFEMMDRQLAQLVRLIDELLDVSRIATGKIVLRREKVDLRDVVQQALEGSQPALQAGAQHVSVKLPPDEVPVFGDASRLAQALQNIINNAAKYTPAGGRITIIVFQDGDEAVVSVEDTGMGIPPVMVERVFELFAQVDSNLDRAQGGLGIGLSLVRSLVGLHGGTVTARSAGTDLGSTFTVRLPALPAPAVAPIADGHLPPPADKAARRLRVLVVDDNADAADTLGMLLEQQGHQVRVEYAGSAALGAARELHPEAVFCDLGMPGMSGLEVARQLRQDRHFASTLLVALTGWGADDDVRRTRAAGFDEHLVKPVTLSTIESVLGRR